MKAWILDGERICDGPYVFLTRKDAEAKAKKLLRDVWDAPCTAPCGSTQGIEVHRTDGRTAYVWGDGYVAQVRRAK